MTMSRFSRYDDESSVKDARKIVECANQLLEKLGEGNQRCESTLIAKSTRPKWHRAAPLMPDDLRPDEPEPEPNEPDEPDEPDDPDVKPFISNRPNQSRSKWILWQDGQPCPGPDFHRGFVLNLVIRRNKITGKTHVRYVYADDLPHLERQTKIWVILFAIIGIPITLMCMLPALIHIKEAQRNIDIRDYSKAKEDYVYCQACFAFGCVFAIIFAAFLFSALVVVMSTQFHA